MLARVELVASYPLAPCRQILENSAANTSSQCSLRRTFWATYFRYTLLVCAPGQIFSTSVCTDLSKFGRLFISGWQQPWIRRPTSGGHSPCKESSIRYYLHYSQMRACTSERARTHTHTNTHTHTHVHTHMRARTHEQTRAQTETKVAFEYMHTHPLTIADTNGLNPAP